MGQAEHPGFASERCAVRGFIQRDVDPKVRFQKLEILRSTIAALVGLSLYRERSPERSAQAKVFGLSRGTRPDSSQLADNLSASSQLDGNGPAQLCLSIG